MGEVRYTAKIIFFNFWNLYSNEKIACNVFSNHKEDNKLAFGCIDLDQNHCRGESYDVSLEIEEIQALIEKKRKEERDRSSGKNAVNNASTVKRNDKYTTYTKLCFFKCNVTLY